MKTLLALILATTCLFANPLCKLSTIKKQALLSLSYSDFDQNLKKGWRKLTANGCYAEAAKLLDEYRKLNTKQLQSKQIKILFWHAGQMYAFADIYDKAKIQFLGSIEKSPNPNSPIRWNDYVYATVAFLDKDMKKLKFHRDKMAQGPTSNGIVPNLNFIDNFIKCPDQPYRFAYSGCIKGDI